MSTTAGLLTGASLYNEIEPFAADWMRNLAQAGHIATGTVDQRSIRDLRPVDVGGAIQFHAFAGLGAWSYALRLAGWPDDQPVWTGSCPCQPFSSAGLGDGFDDERHLWPAWFDLIRECRPPVVFGEQVASGAGLKWLDLVSSDMESAKYALATANLCAAGVGAPHLRQRLYFVAVADGERLEGVGVHLQERQSRSAVLEATGGGAPGRVADAEGGGASTVQQQGRVQGTVSGREGAVRGFWSNADWLPCRDGKYRPVEPGTFPLAHGATARVGRLRAYGNAIVPEVAATFIRAVMEIRP